jgi:hypothetical protein
MINDIVEDGHVRAAKNALRSTNGLLNDWGIIFLQSMLWAKWPNPRQLTTLELLCAKSRMPAPNARGGGGGRPDERADE